MSILSDIRILEQLYDGGICIEPFINDNMQPASIDLTLNDKIRVLDDSKATVIRAYGKNNERYKEIRINKYQLRPGEFILAEVREKITLGKGFIARIVNRNSLARLGIDVSMGSFINPGYSGQMTIVIKNNNPVPVEICKGMRICQLIIEDVSPMPSFDYGVKEDAKYQNEGGVVPSMLFKDKEYQEFLAKIGEEHDGSKIGEFLVSRLTEKAKSLDGLLTKQERNKLGIK